MRRGEESRQICVTLSHRPKSKPHGRWAGAVAGEIQAWIDRETIARLVAALRQPDGGGAGAARALLGELEARLLSVGRFEPPARQGAGRAGLLW